MVCNSDFCKFNKACSDVTWSPDNLLFTVQDGESKGSMEVSFAQSLLGVNGGELGDTVKTCYFGMFRAYTFGTTWKFGTVFMKNYYVVYDMSPFEKFSKNYIQIGIAPLNPYADIKKIRYDTTYPGL